MRLVHSRPDLPVSWDGEPVEWWGWQTPEGSSLVFHLPVEAFACQECGGIGAKSFNSGARMATVPVLKRAKRSVREYYSSRTERRMIRDLQAYRCRHCGHDQILDERTGHLWDLDETDYTDDGSWEPGQGTLL